jgi:hypothetical protein
MHQPIAAGIEKACCCTGSVVVIGIAEIAGFVAFCDTISAQRTIGVGTVRRAAVAAGSVAVVAVFVAHQTRGDVGANHAIAALSRQAVVFTSVGVVCVCVVAAFVSKSFRVLDICSPESISTCCGYTVLGTGIVVIGIGIITGFTSGY